MTSDKMDALAVLFGQRAAIEAQIVRIVEGTDSELQSAPKRQPRKSKTVRKRAGRKKLTDEQREAVKADIRAGLKPGEICERHGISLPTYSRIKATMPRVSGVFTYRCFGCGKQFKSNLPKLDAYCPQPTCNKMTDIEEVHA